MRGFDQPSDALFVYLSPESFVPKEHPLRPIRQMVDAALVNLSPVFCQMYSHTVGLRYHRSGYSKPCCYRCSTRFPATSNW